MEPVTRILCPVDLSDTSRHAIDHAVAVARWCKASIVGLHVADAMGNECHARLILLHVVAWSWPEPPPPVLQELPPDQAAGLREFRRYVEASATQRLEASPALQR
jgi:nucleotide-binding universal stress UspA family protein